MNKITIIAAIIGCAILTGCQSVFEVTKNPEEVHPIQEVVKVNGQDQVIVSRYERSSGGYNGYYRAPLWSNEHIKGVKASVKTDGTFDLGIQDYQKDLSTNAVTMTREMFSGGAQLVTAIGDAYVKIAGGGAQADTVANLTAKAYNFFKSKGGNIDAAKVTVDDTAKTFKISDGSTCVECSPDGSCKECTACTDGSFTPAAN